MLFNHLKLSPSCKSIYDKKVESMQYHSDFADDSTKVSPVDSTMNSNERANKPSKRMANTSQYSSKYAPSKKARVDASSNHAKSISKKDNSNLVDDPGVQK